MLDRKDMMNLLLEASPSFAPHWQSFLEEWSGEPPEELPLYLALAAYARHLIALLARADTQSFAGIFATVERLIREGDPWVSEAAVIGLLEDLQNRGLHDRTTPEEFVPFLGPLGRKYWLDLEDFWAGRRGPLD